ncbi:MAG: ATP-dependent DNA ligase [Filomicrobium sp.]
MKHFAELFSALDQTTKTNAKVAALATYFREAPDDDKLWTIALLSHKRPRRTVTTTLLREWAAEAAEIPLWLFEEAYPVVGDLAETIALVLPMPVAESDNSMSDWIKVIKGLEGKDDNEKKHQILLAWQALGSTERFLFNKIITGGFRIGVSQKLMTRALAQATGIDEPLLAHRLMGDWSPETKTFTELVLSDDPRENLSRPYPFYLAHPVEGEPDALGPPEEWIAERKWDGIRGQVIIRGGEIYVWSRGEELVTDRFPEFSPFKDFLPDGTVLDGEILPWREGHPLDFQTLQTRINRKSVSKKLLNEAPVVLKAYDLLESGGQDIRDHPFSARRQALEDLVARNNVGGTLMLSPVVPFQSWADLADERAMSRDYGSEGLMLKRKESPYLAGRKKGDWWKWKVNPLTIDAVMIYAQSGHGRRANLFTDLTFAVWRGNELVPCAKAYSGLTDAEFNELTRWIRKNTLERFGPVRSVNAEHVFEIAFEGIQRSSRHKSGVALRFPRIHRWRRDKPIEEANTLSDLEALLPAM